ncbi:MAG: N-acyl-D-glucosamine 2-epimerase [Mariniphaga sp.]|nr:N-acyl-D-glucosamine 2-epimerase [Mariniphaga sp.]
MRLILLITFFCFQIGILNAETTDKKISDKDLLQLNKLKSEVNKNLTDNILPYWIKNMVDPVNGGFYGRIGFDEKKYPEEDKGGILNARILWTFSAAYRVTHDTSYLTVAKRAKDYILGHFVDQLYGGTYRSVNSKGVPSDLRKQTYSQSFFIYALSEYFRATKDQEALDAAKEIYNSLEKYVVDPKSDGYFEVFDRKWKRTNERLIGEKSLKDEKTMNTHLHLLEAYANLYRVWPEPKVGARLKNLILLFNDKIIDPQTFHLRVFLDDNWKSTSTINSYGHDIEASWLLVEAAQILGDQTLLKDCEKISLKIADAACEGLQLDGSLISEKDYLSGEVNNSRDWWPQAEAIVGLINAYELSGEEKYLTKAIKCWDFTNKYLVDHKDGEWFNAVSATRAISKGDKAGFWKCPYHNGRMCMEVIERVSMKEKANRPK